MNWKQEQDKEKDELPSALSQGGGGWKTALMKTQLINDHPSQAAINHADTKQQIIATRQTLKTAYLRCITQAINKNFYFVCTLESALSQHTNTHT